MVASRVGAIVVADTREMVVDMDALIAMLVANIWRYSQMRPSLSSGSPVLPG